MRLWLHGYRAQKEKVWRMCSLGIMASLANCQGLGSLDQLPMNIGDPHYDPLFPFGFGLEKMPSNM
jgi:hypothetical protein